MGTRSAQGAAQSSAALASEKLGRPYDGSQILIVKIPVMEPQVFLVFAVVLQVIHVAKFRVKYEHDWVHL